MEWIVLLGRFLYSLIFILSGIGHLTQMEMMTQYAQAKGLPAARAMVVLTGVVILLGGLGILLGIYVKLAALVLFVFLLVAAFTMHAFWKESDAMAKATEQAMFMKNLALAGAALLIFYFGSGPFSLGG
ncbi:MAG: DoxX family protein [Calditrichaeota bacterium]|nr:MAG: DoxX family protein [Calditrichota bacterium]